MDRAGAARDGLRRADLRGPRRARGGSPTAPEPVRSQAATAPSASTACRFAYEPGRPVLEEIDLEIPAGHTRRADRPDGLRARRRSRRSCRASTTSRRGACSSTASTCATSRAARSGGRSASSRRIPFLFSASVRDNIAFGVPDAPADAVEAAARAAQAHAFVEELPGGYDTMIGERGITLSGGQRQRHRDRARARSSTRGS